MISFTHFTKTLLFLFSVLAVTNLDGQSSAFITTWNTDPYVSGTSTITIPTKGDGYNYSVDWNDDGVYDQTGITGSVTHDFNTPGIYTIRIKGNFPRIYFKNNFEERYKILEIKQWGTISWKNFEGAFEGCQYLASSATDIPNLSAVEDMSYAFSFTKFNQANIGSWNVSKVTNMSFLFSENFDFNQPLNNWNVSKVKTMESMFNRTSFNQPLDNWDVSKVKNMRNMFSGSRFDQPIGNWNVSSVTNMSGLFNGCPFNQPLNDWNVSKVTDMSLMFASTPFNYPLNNWNVSKVESFRNMFTFATSFNQPLDNWNVKKATTMEGMFLYAIAFNQPLNTWDVSNVTNMREMFVACENYNQPMSNWNTSKVTDMHAMFIYCSSFNQPLNNWDVSKVTDMGLTFYEATNFNQPLNNWNVSKVTDMRYIFLNTKFDQDISNWDVSKVTNMTGMFRGTSFNQDISNWNTSSATNISYLFSSCPFNQNINNWDVSNVTDFSSVFENNSAFNQPLDNWDVSNATAMALIFSNATSFNQNLDTWDVSKASDLFYAFNGATSFNQSLGSWTLNQYVSVFGIFENSAVDCANYSATLKGWAENPLTPSYIYFVSADRFYGQDVIAERDYLINDLLWYIEDAGVTDYDCLPANNQSITVTSKNQGKDILVFSHDYKSLINREIEIEYSKDGISYEKIARISKDDHSKEAAFSFLHQNPGDGTHFYRLKVIKANDKFDSSNVTRSRIYKQTLDIQLYPNPASTKINIKSDEAINAHTYAIFDMNGKIINKGSVIDNAINVSDIQNGIYIIHLFNGSNELASKQKVVVMH